MSSGISPHDRVERGRALARQGRAAEAYRVLADAVSTGDAIAAATLADWRLSGDLVRRDLAEARRLYGQAASLGHDAAEPIHIALLANGAGGSGRDWPAALDLLRQRAARDPAAREQCRLIEAMRIDSRGDPLDSPAREEIRAAPLLERLPGFLSPDECRYLVQLASPDLQPSLVVDPRTGRMMRDPVRTGRSAGFPFVREDPVLHAINRRIAAATATRYEQGEPLQVLAYRPGEEYRLHSDALPPGQQQRIATVLVTIDARFEGGETSFPRLGLDLRGRPGEAFHFANLDDAGKPAGAMWHAGLPVTRGRKLILSKWIRERDLDLTGPPGRPC